jgi:hypothetical protein
MRWYPWSLVGLEIMGLRITDPAYTVIDMFLYRNVIGLPLAIEALKEILRTHKANPAELATIAVEEHAWGVRRPYLEALAHDG